MLCCLLFAMLFAQVMAFICRGRAWLGRAPQKLASVAKGVAGGILWRRRGAVMISMQLIAALVLVLNWEHLVHEVRSVVAPADRTSPLGRLCSDPPSVAQASAAPFRDR